MTIYQFGHQLVFKSILKVVDQSGVSLGAHDLSIVKIVTAVQKDVAVAKTSVTSIFPTIGAKLYRWPIGYMGCACWNIG